MKRNIIISLSALILTAALVLTAVVSPASVTAVNAGSIGVASASTEYEFEKLGFKNSMDYLVNRDGWIYGADYNTHTSLWDACANLSDNVLCGVPSAFSLETIRRDFINMRACGFNCTQWWMMWDLQGVVFDENGIATGVLDMYLDNTRAMLQAAREADICIVPNIFDHNLLGNSQGGDDGQGFVDLNAQLKYTRFQWDPVAQDAWLENVVKPIAEVFAEYPDVVIAVGVAVENISGWVNDYELGILRSGLNGTTWANFSEFLNRQNEVIKEILPNTPTSIEAMGDFYNTNIRSGLYIQNELDMDFVCENYYHSGGYIEPISVGYATRPGWIGEMNVFLDGGNANATEDYRTAVQQKTYKSAKANGWLGAFLHRYSAGDCTHTGASLANYEDYQMWIATWRYDIQEQIDEFLISQGREDEVVEYQPPVPLYYQGGTTLYWFNGEGTAAVDIERSEDGGNTWKYLAKNLNALDALCGNGIGKFVDSTCVDQTTYRYRITAIFEDGTRVTSKDTNDSLFWIPPNVVKNPGFEDSQTFVNDYWTGWHTYDGADIAGATAITDEQAHSGQYSLKVDSLNVEWGYATVNQYIEEIEPATTYRLTVWRKCEAKLYYDENIISDSNEPASVCLARKTSGSGSFIQGWFFGSPTENNDWQMHSMDIGTGPYEEVGILIRSGTKNARMCNYYDDFSVVQVR